MVRLVLNMNHLRPTKMNPLYERFGALNWLGPTCPADNCLFDVTDVQIVHEDAFRNILIIYGPCQTVCVVNSYQLPWRGGLYDFVLINTSTGNHMGFDTVFGAN
jgi:hypothetical protein